MVTFIGLVQPRSHLEGWTVCGCLLVRGISIAAACTRPCVSILGDGVEKDEEDEEDSKR